MRALVTGATGCLGRNLVNRLLGEGWEVSATGRNMTIGSLLEAQGAIFHHANLEDKDAVLPLCERKDVVFHCGALSSSWGKYEAFYRANVLGTKNVVEGCLKHGVRRVVHVSTPSVYFDFKEKHCIGESDVLPTRPVNHYVATKLEAEQIVDRAFKRHDLGVITIRPRAIFGPYDTAIMPRIIRASKRGRVPLVNGGEAVIDATYVGNVVESLILSACAGDHALGNKYNITNGEPVLIKDLLQRSFIALGLPFKPRKIPYPVAYRVATIMEVFASLPFVTKEPVLTKYGVGVLGIGQTLDISAAYNDLNYKPVVKIQQGIDQFARWWKEEGDVA